MDVGEVEVMDVGEVEVVDVGEVEVVDVEEVNSLAVVVEINITILHNKFRLNLKRN